MMAVLEGFLGLPTTRACASEGPRPVSSDDVTAARREEMVKRQIEARGVKAPAVLAAMRKVPRHAFVPATVANIAYQDHPLPIGWRQTVSQPYIVALMSELAAVRPGARVLEVGTGSGYQAAVLGELGAEVYTIEIIEPLAKRAAATLAQAGYGAVHTRIGDGYRGWPEAAPFDAILVTAAPPMVPLPLKQQLKVGGRLVLPVGTHSQDLKVITRTEQGWDERTVLAVVFVPMTGEAQSGPPDPKP
jgi:protein-L-isoaspartate(D-aspartate) O-methyltransferase